MGPMKHIKSVEQLLFSVAKQGDPSAFYALFEDQIDAVIRCSIHEQQDEHSICSIIDEGMRAIYSRFFHSCKQSPHQWLKQQLLDEFDFSGEAESFEPADADIIQTCRKAVMVGLQRKHHELFAGRKAKKAFAAQSQRRLFVVTGGVFFAALMVGYGILLLTGTTLSVNLQSAGKQFMFSLPFSSPDASEKDNSEILVESVKDTADTSISADTTDTLAVVPAVKKKAHDVKMQNAAEKKYSRAAVGSKPRQTTVKRGKKKPSSENRLSMTTPPAEKSVARKSVNANQQSPIAEKPSLSTASQSEKEENQTISPAPEAAGVTVPPETSVAEQSPVNTPSRESAATSEPQVYMHAPVLESTETAAENSSQPEPVTGQENSTNADDGVGAENDLTTE